MADITSEESFKAWLDGKDKDICVVLASRIALRVLPIVADFVHQDVQKRSEAINLPLFRASAAPWFAGTCPNQEGAEVAVSAAFAVGDAYRAADAAAAARAYASSAVYRAADAVSSAFASADAAVSAASAAGDASASASADAADVASAAGDAADASASAARVFAADIWLEINWDVRAFESGTLPKDIMRLPLWQGQVPSEISENWSLLKSDLLSLNDNWQVWTDWYDDRLIGGTTPNGRPVIEELELKRVLISDEDWEKGPSHVNAMIAEMEAEYRPFAPVPPIEVPDQRPAIIEVEVGEDGKLHRRIPHAPEVRDKAQEESLREAWQAHRHQLDDLLAIQQGHNDPVLQSILSRYVDALGNVYESINIIAVGIHGERLKAQAKRADERYLEHIAGELEAMAIAHDFFVRQFPKWREHLDIAKEPASDETIKAAIEFPNSLSKADIITSEVKEPLNDLAQDTLTSDPDFRPTLSNELLHSEENILAALLGWAVKHIKEAGGKRNKISFEKIAAIVTIMQNLPILLTQIWGWVEPVLNFVKRILGLS